MRTNIEKLKAFHNPKFSIFDFIKRKNKDEPPEKK